MLEVNLMDANAAQAAAMLWHESAQQNVLAAQQNFNNIYAQYCANLAAAGQQNIVPYPPALKSAAMELADATADLEEATLAVFYHLPST